MTVATDTIASIDATTVNFDWRAGLRDYQVEAVDSALTGLPEHLRGTIVMACGSGKTIVSVRTADVLAGAPSDSVLVLAPSLALLDQLFRRWSECSLTQFVPLAVCSDDEIGNSAADDGRVGAESTAIAATTNPEEVAAFLSSATDSPKVVFATYHSTPVVAEATKTSCHEWTLAVCDEAHRTAGKSGAVFTTALSDAELPCRMRLFLTASPRVHGAAASNDGRELISMDDEVIYGPRLFTYTFARGIEEGWLSDYRVLVVVVDSAEAYRSIYQGHGLAFEGHAVSAERAARVLGLLRATEEHDLTRVIAFHNTITASRHFAADLLHLSPHTNSGDSNQVQAFHLDGLASPAERKAALAGLESPAKDTRVVVNNVRVLGEGVDIPALDGVMFAEPKSSQVDVIQAVGRAIRRKADRDAPSVVIIPVYLAQGENPDAVLSGSVFKHVWQVLNALRDHDTALDSELSSIRRNAYDPTRPPYEPGVMPERVQITGVSASAEEFTSAITTMLLDRTTTTWAYGYDRFVEYRQRHGTGSVPARHVDEVTKFPLGQWVQSQRQAYRWDRLSPEQISQLENAGFEWGQRSAQWRKHIALVRTLATGTGSWMTTTDLCFLAPSLAPWFRSVQRRRDKGQLTDSERDELSDLCVWGVDPLNSVFDDPNIMKTLLRSVRKRGKLPKGNVTIGERSVSPARIKDMLDLAARHALLTEDQRSALAHAGINLPDVAADIDITKHGWEPAALRQLAAVTATAVTSQDLETGTQRAGRHAAEGAVSLASLVTGPHGFWKRTRMIDHPEAKQGFEDVLPRASALVEDAESRIGREDQFIVRADMSVWRKPNDSDQWCLAGRFHDHVDGIVAVIATNPDADDSDGPTTVVVDEEAGTELPQELRTAITKAVNDTILPHPGTLGTHLLKSYGVKRVHVFPTHDEANEFVARAHRRGQQPAWITNQISDDITGAIKDIQTKLIRESLSLTLPKVATAYRAGQLEHWSR